jgi:hypothetical protein
MTVTSRNDAAVAEQVKLAAEAYVYGYPLVYGLHEAAAFVAGAGGFPAQAPYNVFGHARQLAGPDLKFVSPNNDTCYSIAVCDVRHGPLVLHVPDTAGRYYVLQFVDAWTNNFAYIGRRATGTAEAEFLLAGPGYDGEAPDGMRLVRAPSGVFVIVGRTQVNGQGDLPAVHALQDQFTLTPLAVREGGGEPTPVAGIPAADPGVGKDLEWWEQCRVLLTAFPPPPADAEFMALCGQFGLTEAASPYVDVDPERTAVLVAGSKAGRAKIEELMKQVHTTPAGWQMSPHLFDYNLDHFEIGAMDSPEWKIADRAQAYVTRAVMARAGLWGNHGYEAAYAPVWVDADGEPLDGAHRYELQLAPPPVDAFWSLTMYAPPDFYLVANPIDRYAIGDRTPGFKQAADGSVTIFIQMDSPGPEKESNWLPSPSGPFRPIMRMYQPRDEILDGDYALPAIRRVG